jgi:prepilin-type N-terminal cleavage/methylation domain-containing protein
MSDRPQNCMDCRYATVLPDPDPQDAFCDNDQKIVCNLNYQRPVAVAVRLYNLRKEATIPNWCPLGKQGEQNMKKGFTLVELIVCISIIGLLAALLIPTLGGGCSLGNYQAHTFQAEVVRKYESHQDDGDGGNITIYHVDIRRPGSDKIEVLTNRDDFFQSKRDSITLQANLLQGEIYQFEVRGEHNTFTGALPNIIKATHVPKKPKAEIDY